MLLFLINYTDFMRTHAPTYRSCARGVGLCVGGWGCYELSSHFYCIINVEITTCHQGSDSL